MSLSIIILAAGEGTRMQSTCPKVLHSLAGKYLLSHVIDSSKALSPEQLIVVTGFAGAAVKEAINDDSIDWVTQAEQQGTGHAVLQCLPVLNVKNDVLVLYGDVPLISAETLTSLINKAADSAVSLLSFKSDNPFGYGRIIRDDAENIKAIIEQKDLLPDQEASGECNSGIMFLAAEQLKNLLSKLDNNNSQAEYYLTDVVVHAKNEGLDVSALVVKDNNEVMGVNDQQQLAEAEAVLRQRNAAALLKQGVKLVDPQRFDQRGIVIAGKDVVIDINVILEGNIEIDDQVSIGPNCVLKNVTIKAGSTILANSLLEDCLVGRNVTIGPFARIRPGSVLNDNSKIGNFVEIKKSVIGVGSKVNHLSYIGDATLGQQVNIGAGVITCNYDGANKYKTTIGDNVFVGSDCQLIAPVVIGNGSTIGAGSTITKDTPENKLTFSRSAQKTIPGWQRPCKKSADK
ncbi:MAG: bifunctional UDP-N-acetylglucosamine diphosphorylase/glucosamine-1-phosphate N-acetyltransferase GlmU [Gammaproteobacteria bacterium]|nr:bifunctional UDP-N-acetylglucosamine diphosphorylase/glucosamine-1-phosphate N-acetyltransferase GlmU [Gammaproteobacteria bacterium]